MENKSGSDRQAEILDVQLLDVLAQVEAVLRHGREVQREALRFRGIPSLVDHRRRRAAGTAIRDRIDQMHSDCSTLVLVVEELQRSAQQLDRFLAT